MKLLKYLLVLMLLLAPVQGVFANTLITSMEDYSSLTTNTTEHNMGSDQNTPMHSNNSNGMSSEHVDHASNVDCESECVNCVFCGAAFSSVILTSASLHSIYIPHQNLQSVGITTDVAIRPPR